MNYKLRFFLLILLLTIKSVLFGQDSAIVKGFATASEAADSIWARMSMKKFQTLHNFIVSDSQFLAETRKIDTITPTTFISGQYMNYASRVNRSGKKTYKSLKKSKIPLKKSVRDTLLLYSSVDGFNKSELYFKYKKRSGYIRYNLWLVNDRWYLTGKIDWIEN